MCWAVRPTAGGGGGVGLSAKEDIASDQMGLRRVGSRVLRVDQGSRDVCAACLGGRREPLPLGWCAPSPKAVKISSFLEFLKENY